MADHVPKNPTELLRTELAPKVMYVKWYDVFWETLSGAPRFNQFSFVGETF